jgi:hypothetical protein
MMRSVPQAVWPAPEGAEFNVEGPARTLNQRAQRNAQARKADRPRLSACTNKGPIPASFQGAVPALAISLVARAT